MLAPADYFGCQRAAGTLSFIWCNPPFDDEYGGGGRVEREFLEAATRQLKTMASSPWSARRDCPAERHPQPVQDVVRRRQHGGVS